MTNDEHRDSHLVICHSSFVIFPMPSRRLLKAAEAIREVVSMAILTDLRDPRIEGVTVTYVEVSPDMRQAKVHVSIMGSEAQQKLCLHGLQSSAGYLQSKISDRIDTRYTPRLQFMLDEGVKKSLAISRMLRELLPDTEQPDTGAAADVTEPED
jgi:ribosome-binding factor A